MFCFIEELSLLRNQFHETHGSTAYDLPTRIPLQAIESAVKTPADSITRINASQQRSTPSLLQPEQSNGTVNQVSQRRQGSVVAPSRQRTVVVAAAAATPRKLRKVN